VDAVGDAGASGSGSSAPASQQQPQQAASDTRGPTDAPSLLDMDEDNDMAAAIAASLADAAGSQQEQQEQQEDPPAPLADEPPPGPGVVELALRLPSGQRSTRRFEPATDRLSALYTFAAGACGAHRGTLALSTAFPKKVLARCSFGSGG
jgi:hypothetical protein